MYGQFSVVCSLTLCIIPCPTSTPMHMTGLSLYLCPSWLSFLSKDWLEGEMSSPITGKIPPIPTSQPPSPPSLPVPPCTSSHQCTTYGVVLLQGLAQTWVPPSTSQWRVCCWHQFLALSWSWANVGFAACSVQPNTWWQQPGGDHRNPVMPRHQNRWGWCCGGGIPQQVRPKVEGII